MTAKPSVKRQRGGSGLIKLARPALCPVGCCDSMSKYDPFDPAMLVSRALLLLALALVASCASFAPDRAGSGEWVSPNVAPDERAAIANLDWSTLPGVITLIDGREVGAGYRQARLAPGRHVIEYAYYPAAFGDHPKGRMEIELMSGHSYEFRIKLCFWCMPRKYAVWMDNKTSREKVWGKRPDWPAWYL